MKPLRFIHIAKTGGQAIAAVAKNHAGLSWGMFDKDYGTKGMCHKLLSNVENPDIINKHDWFTVVRNPYERIVSQYNWHISRLREAIEVNTYLHRELEKYDPHFTYSSCHFTEQHRYLEPQYNIRVLRYENLKEDFNSLMKEYGYNIVLNKKVNVSIKVASLYDLSLETIELINKVYEKDFTTFGYEMVHSVFQKPSPENSASVAS
jgi:hypothetical protein